MYPNIASWNIKHQSTYVANCKFCSGKSVRVNSTGKSTQLVAHWQMNLISVS